MARGRVKKIITSIYLIFVFVTVGFSGFFVFDDIFENNIVEAATIVVDAGGGGSYTKIQDAINNSSDGDTIRVWAGIYYGNLTINKKITLIGNSTDDTIIDTENAYLGVLINFSQATITGFTIINGTYGIYIWGGQQSHIYNNKLINNTNGFGMMFSNNNRIENNIIENNSFYGIQLYKGESNIIINNSVDQNDWTGIYLSGTSKNNRIINNSFNNNNNYGILLLDFSSYNTFINNTSNFNQLNGLRISFECDSNTVKNCTFNNNGWDGIFIGSKQNTIIDSISSYNNWSGISPGTEYDIQNNTINFNNDSGINSSGLKTGIMINNTCNNNVNVGINLYDVDAARVSYNNCSKNKYGIKLELSNNNVMGYNNVSENEIGLFVSSDSNSIYEHTISANTNFGIVLGVLSKNNYLFHNNILLNNIQAIDNGINYWNNSVLEGNFWSDYNGFDNGNGGRILGDGIGDTALPHNGYDFYPFIKQFGWILPDKPSLDPFNDLVIDGNYTLTWTNTNRSTGYILEEAPEITFQNSTIEYDGINNALIFYFKNNGTYFYRVRSYNERFKSPWSDVLEINVDWAPGAPRNLTITNISSNQISLKWSLNNEIDIQGYRILVNETNKGASGPYVSLAILPSTIDEYTVGNLAEVTTYHFVVIAFDENNTNSSYSNVMSATTRDETPPGAPIWQSFYQTSNTEVYVSWYFNQEPDIKGYYLYMNASGMGPYGDFDLERNLPSTISNARVSGLVKETAYYFRVRAYDESSNYSPYSEVIMIYTADQVKPDRPMGLMVTNPTESSLTLSWDKNTAEDVVSYNIYRSTWASGSYNMADTVDAVKSMNPGGRHEYIDTELSDATDFYFKIIAVDDAGLESYFSDVASGTTLMGQRPPVVNVTIKNIEIMEDSYDHNSIRLHVMFVDPNDDPLTFECEGNENIAVTMEQATGVVKLTPDANWNGKEFLKFTATDGISSERFHTVTVKVISLPDAPTNASVLEPADGAVFSAITPITFIANCDDPDIPFGDTLTYEWVSQISGDLGNEIRLSDVLLPPGKHVITCTITDVNGSVVKAMVNFTVLSAKQQDKNDDGGRSLGFYAGITGAVAMVVIVALLILLFFRKRRRDAEGTGDGKTTLPGGGPGGPSQAPLPQPQPQPVPQPVSQPYQAPEYAPHPDYAQPQDHAQPSQYYYGQPPTPPPQEPAPYTETEWIDPDSYDQDEYEDDEDDEEYEEDDVIELSEDEYEFVLDEEE